MKNILLVVLTTLAFPFAGKAQKAPVKFGDVSVDELKMSVYPKDSTAEAVVLADFGESEIRYNQSTGFSLEFDRTTRIKIFKKDGLKWADFEIPLWHEGAADEKITNLKAITYNLENGKIVESKARSESIFKEEYNENLNLVKVTLPNVKEGSVLEITYKITSEFLFNFQDWQFQSRIPVVWSEYRASIPEFFDYHRYTQGYVPLDINEYTERNTFITLTSSERSEGYVQTTTFSNQKIDYKEGRFRWVAKDVPAFRDEPFMTTHKDYLSKINFELAYIKMPHQPVKQIMGSWEQINTRYAENSEFLGEITGNGFLKKTAEEITNGLTSDEQKITAINSYVKKNILWNGSSQKFSGMSLRKVLEEKKGNSAGINLLLGSLLDKAGFTVSPVLLSTRDHGFLRETTPVSSQFNYVICAVDLGGKKILLDGTDNLLPTAVLPERCLNGRGLVVSKAGPSWVDLKSPAKSRTYFAADLKVDGDGALNGNVNVSRTGYHAKAARTAYSKGEEEYLKRYTAGRSWQIGKHEFQNIHEVSESFKEQFDVAITDHVIAGGENLYLNPFVHLREEENPFKSELRQYPVDFGSGLEKIYIVKLRVPEGYKVDEIPQNKIIALPENAARYSYSVVQMGDQVSITSSLQINRSIFVQDQYADLRAFYDHVIAKQAEQIVLKKN